jgi:hypothetical protein
MSERLLNVIASAALASGQTLILRSGLLAASRRMAASGPWFETAPKGASSP